MFSIQMRRTTTATNKSEFLEQFMIKEPPNHRKNNHKRLRGRHESIRTRKKEFHIQQIAHPKFLFDRS